MKNNLKIFATSQDVATSLIEFMVELCENKLRKKEQVSIALPGGSTPKIVFEMMANSYRDKLPWDRIHFFWGDERCVAPTHHESNFQMTKSALFDKIQMPGKNIHRVFGENDPNEEAQRYGEEIRSSVSVKNNLPCFDIVILGIGADGHTASIFPNQMELLKTGDICAVATHPQSGQKRITITGKTLSNADNIVFLATGEGKADILHTILAKKEDFESLPASYFRGSNVKFFVDKAAVSKIQSS
ncbi:MAG: 6-phosphogluconolactonase [Bacteroidales bacterium]|nr:6-phosphogluconolactonase [Bacteroidales bacterium]